MSECTCPIEPNMNYDELRAIISNVQMCSDSRVNPGRGWICPNLDKELRRADGQRQWRARLDKAKNAR